jgi:hypothetical protein
LAPIHRKEKEQKGLKRVDHMINIEEAGIHPNSGKDCLPQFQQILQSIPKGTPTTITIPTGVYHCFPAQSVKKEYYMSNTTDINPKNCGILLDHLNNVTIEGNGATFIFHDRMSAFTVDHSSNIKIHNLKIDWARPLQSESRVVESGKRRIVIELDGTKYPYYLKSGKIIFTAKNSESQWWGVMEFDPVDRVIPLKTGDASLGNLWRLYKAKKLGGNLVELKGRFLKPPKVGNYLVMRHHERDHAGIFITESHNVTIEKVDMYANAGLGILSQYSKNLIFQGIRFVPNRERHVIVSGHDDGLQFSNCKGDLLVEQCEFEGLMDDPINVHGTSVKIIRILSDRSVQARFMHAQSEGMPFGFQGDRIGFIDRSSMETVGEAHIQTITHQSTQEFTIIFDAPIPTRIKSGDALENLTWTPNITIRDSRFLSCRARGILISTPGKVRIENNYFKTSGTAILIAGDANGWYESGAVKDVLIRNNEFSDFCLMNMYQFCEGIISIYPIVPKPNHATPFHENIIIEANKFTVFDNPVLYALSTKNVVFRGNSILKSNRFRPFHRRKAMLTFECCQQIGVAHNQSDTKDVTRNIKLIRTPASELHITKD